MKLLCGQVVKDLLGDQIDVREYNYNTCTRVHTHTVHEYRPDNCLSFHALFWLSPLVPPQTTPENSMGQCVTILYLWCSVPYSRIYWRE